MPQSFFLTDEVLQKALKASQFSIETILTMESGHQGFVRISILGLSDLTAVGVIEVCSASVGQELPVAEWKYPYHRLAVKKAEMSWREKMNLTKLLQRPTLLQNGDTIYKGAVYGDGVAVGVSGVSEEGDEQIAEIVLNSIFVFAKEVFDIVRQTEANFLEAS